MGRKPSEATHAERAQDAWPRESTIRTFRLGVVAVGGVALLATVAIAGIPLFHCHQPKIDVDLSSLDRVKPGMTEEEITALVRVPPGDYTTRRTGYDFVFCGFTHREPVGPSKQWLFNARCMLVSFRDGRSHYILFGEGFREETRLEQRFRDCVRWLTLRISRVE
jgi:hypothetical protein